MPQVTAAQELQIKAQMRLASLMEEKLVTRISVLSTLLGGGKITERLFVRASSAKVLMRIRVVRVYERIERNRSARSSSVSKPGAISSIRRISYVITVRPSAPMPILTHA